MAPEISTAMAVIAMVEKMGGWEVGSIVAVIFIVPPVIAYMGIRTITKALYGLREEIAASKASTERELAEFIHRYDNNIELVKNYQGVAESLAEIIHRNTVAMTKLVDRIDTMRRGK